MSVNWISCKLAIPAENEVVLTRIKDDEGIRNVVPLRRRGKLWFHPDGDSYVYYTPTHWKVMPPKEDFPHHD